MKKIYLILILSILLSCFGVHYAVAQVPDQIILNYTDASLKGYGTDYTSSYGMGARSYISYDVMPPKTGQYALFLTYSWEGTTIEVQLDSIKQAEVVLGVGDKTEVKLAEILLYQNAARNLSLAVPSNVPGTIQFWSIRLEYIGDFEFGLQQDVGACTDTNVIASTRYGNGSGVYGFDTVKDQYIEFSVNIIEQAHYSVSFLAGSSSNTQSIAVTVSVEGAELPVTVTQSYGGFPNCNADEYGQISLLSGQHKIRLTVKSSGSCHVKKLIMSRVGDYKPPTTFKVQFEDYNSGGQNVGYYDTTIGVDLDWCLQRGDDVEVGSNGLGGLITSMTATEWLKYDIEIPVTGKYELTCNYSLGSVSPGEMSVSVDGKEDLIFKLPSTSAWQNYSSTVMGRIYLEEGTHTLKFLLSSEGLSADYFVLNMIGSEMNVQEVLADETNLMENSEANCSMDVISIKFNDNIDATRVKNENVVLHSATEEIPLVLTVNDDTVTAVLTKSLIINTNYELLINNIYDEDNILCSSPFSLSFVASSNYNKTASLTVSYAELVHENMRINGTVISSAKIGIEGREVFLYSAYNTESSIASCVSEENGVFNLTYIMPAGSQEGNCNFLIKTVYSSSVYPISLAYVTEETENQFLSSLSKTTNVTSVLSLLEEYEDIIGINMSKDLDGITDTEVILSGFVGLKINSVNVMRDKYYSRIAMMKLTEADSMSELEVILANEAISKSLRFDTVKYSYIRKGKNDYLTKILELSFMENEQEFMTKLKDMTNEFVLKEYDKENLDLSVQDQNIYVGQYSKLDLPFINTVTDVKRIILFFNCNNTELLKTAEFISEGTATISTKYQDDQLEVDILPNNEEIKTLGNLKFYSNDIGSYQLKVSGSVIYDFDLPFELISNLYEKNVTVKVLKNERKAEGGSSSGGLSKGLGGVAISKDPALDTSETSKTSDYVFIDLDSVKWAETSVYYLLQSNILAQSEDKIFRPNDPVSREEFVKMMVLALGLFDKNAQTNLSDVKNGQWYSSYIASAEAAGLIKGNENGFFGVGQSISREDIAVIIGRALLLSGYDDGKVTEELFADDASISDYAKSSVYFMKEMNLIHGMGDNIFVPKQSATRAMTAKMVYEMMKAVGK